MNKVDLGAIPVNMFAPVVPPVSPVSPVAPNTTQATKGKSKSAKGYLFRALVRLRAHHTISTKQAMEMYRNTPPEQRKDVARAMIATFCTADSREIETAIVKHLRPCALWLCVNASFDTYQSQNYCLLDITLQPAMGSDRGRERLTAISKIISTFADSLSKYDTNTDCRTGCDIDTLLQDRAITGYAVGIIKADEGKTMGETIETRKMLADDAKKCDFDRMDNGLLWATPPQKEAYDDPKGIIAMIADGYPEDIFYECLNSDQQVTYLNRFNKAIEVYNKKLAQQHREKFDTYIICTAPKDRCATTGLGKSGFNKWLRLVKLGYAQKDCCSLSASERAYESFRPNIHKCLYINDAKVGGYDLREFLRLTDPNTDYYPQVSGRNYLRTITAECLVIDYKGTAEDFAKEIGCTADEGGAGQIYARCTHVFELGWKDETQTESILWDVPYNESTQTLDREHSKKYATKSQMTAELDKAGYPDRRHAPKRKITL